MCFGVDIVTFWIMKLYTLLWMSSNWTVKLTSQLGVLSNFSSWILIYIKIKFVCAIRKCIDSQCKHSRRSWIQCEFVILVFFVHVERNHYGSTSAILEYLLAALNAFVKSCAEDCRGQVCRLGETLFPILLQMWKKTQPTNSTFKV